MTNKPLNVLLLAGGVGGAKMAEGLQSNSNIVLTILGNIGDDDSFHGLWVSPDIDTMIYTLSEEINRKQGWGVREDDYKALSFLSKLGADTWMSLGDKDFGLHIYRTERLRRGDRASDITKDIAKAFGIEARIILPSDDIVQTKVLTDKGWLTFQEYFVKYRHDVAISSVRFNGSKEAKATPGVIDVINKAEIVIIAPSNPLVSIAPIFSVPEISEAIKARKKDVVAVSPIIAGAAIKGPADRLLNELGHEASVEGVAKYYQDWISALVIDNADFERAKGIESLGSNCVVTETVMADSQIAASLGSTLLGLKDEFL